MVKATEEIEVQGPAGGLFIVLTSEEADLYNQLVDRYTHDNSFQNITDLQDLESVLRMEILSSRYANWLSTEFDYFGEPIDVKQVTETLKMLEGELRQRKKAMGIDRTSRQKDSSESLSDYIEKLKVRAKEFGVMREEQLTSALTLFHDLQALVTLHDNCFSDEDKRVNRVRYEDIFEWMREVAFPEFNAIDQYFIENKQRFYVTDQ